MEHLCLATAAGAQCRVVLGSRVTTHSNDLKAINSKKQIFGRAATRLNKSGPVQVKTHKLEYYQSGLVFSFTKGSVVLTAGSKCVQSTDVWETRSPHTCTASCQWHPPPTLARATRGTHSLEHSVRLARCTHRGALCSVSLVSHRCCLPDATPRDRRARCQSMLWRSNLRSRLYFQLRSQRPLLNHLRVVPRHGVTSQLGDHHSFQHRG